MDDDLRQVGFGDFGAFRERVLTGIDLTPDVSARDSQVLGVVAGTWLSCSEFEGGFLTSSGCACTLSSFRPMPGDIAVWLPEWAALRTEIQAYAP